MDGIGEASVPDQIVNPLSGHASKNSTGWQYSERYRHGKWSETCMTLVFFNPYACLVIECWHAKMKGIPGVLTDIKYKYGEKLFKRYTRNAKERKHLEWLLDDNGAPLASTRICAEKTVAESEVNIHKTGHLV